MPLYDSQRHSVAWMRGVERAIDEGGNALRYAAHLAIGSGGWAYDVTHECFAHRRRPIMLKARFKGAVLTDSVGTGKTACALSLIALDTQLGEAGGPSGPDAAPAESEPQLPMLQTSATLVVVPLNLPQQWAGEIDKFLAAPGLRVLQLCSARDAKGVTLDDMRTAHMVITTTNFMRCKAYADALDDLLRDLFGAAARERRREQPLLCAAARALARRPREGMFPFVELVHWRRVVVDEVLSTSSPTRPRASGGACCAASTRAAGGGSPAHPTGPGASPSSSTTCSSPRRRSATSTATSTTRTCNPRWSTRCSAPTARPWSSTSTCCTSCACRRRSTRCSPRTRARAGASTPSSRS